MFRRPDGHALHVCKATRPEGLHREICQALDMDTNPGGTQKLISILLWIVVLLAGTTPARSTDSEKLATVTIEIRNFRFTPVRVTVEPGTTIRWINRDEVAHDVTSGTAVTGRRARQMARTRFPDGRFSSGPFGPGDSYSVILTEPGEYPYYCSIHPFMAGGIVVK